MKYHATVAMAAVPNDRSRSGYAFEVRLYGLRCTVVRDAILLSVSPKPTIGKWLRFRWTCPDLAFSDQNIIVSNFTFGW